MISVIDRTAEDPVVDAKIVAKRGVVIETFEDGHVYGQQELAHPLFRILKLPGVPVAFGRSFMGHEIADHPHALRRLFKLDLDHPDVPADLRAHLEDESRAEPHIVVDQAMVAGLKRRRPTGDPNAIGEPAHVIG